MKMNLRWSQILQTVTNWKDAPLEHGNDSTTIKMNLMEINLKWSKLVCHFLRNNLNKMNLCHFAKVITCTGKSSKEKSAIQYWKQPYTTPPTPHPLNLLICYSRNMHKFLKNQRYQFYCQRIHTQKCTSARVNFLTNYPGFKNI